MVLKRKRGDSEEVETSAMAPYRPTSLSQVYGTNNELSTSSIQLKNSRNFKCKTCNREFSTFQALGGHRASHKMPSKLINSQQEFNLSNSLMELKMHECWICGAKFPIGQALGGHMRKHRDADNIDETELARIVHKVLETYKDKKLVKKLSMKKINYKSDLIQAVCEVLTRYNEEYVFKILESEKHNFEINSIQTAPRILARHEDKPVFEKSTSERVNLCLDLNLTPHEDD